MINFRPPYGASFTLEQIIERFTEDGCVVELMPSGRRILVRREENVHRTWPIPNIDPGRQLSQNVIRTVFRTLGMRDSE